MYWRLRPANKLCLVWGPSPQDGERDGCQVAKASARALMNDLSHGLTVSQVSLTNHTQLNLQVGSLEQTCVTDLDLLFWALAPKRRFRVSIADALGAWSLATWQTRELSLGAQIGQGRASISGALANTPPALRLDKRRAVVILLLPIRTYEYHVGIQPCTHRPRARGLRTKEFREARPVALARPSDRSPG